MSPAGCVYVTTQLDTGLGAAAGQWSARCADDVRRVTSIIVVAITPANSVRLIIVPNLIEQEATL